MIPKVTAGYVHSREDKKGNLVNGKRFRGLVLALQQELLPLKLLPKKKTKKRRKEGRKKENQLILIG